MWSLHAEARLGRLKHQMDVRQGAAKRCLILVLHAVEEVHRVLLILDCKGRREANTDWSAAASRIENGAI